MSSHGRREPERDEVQVVRPSRAGCAAAAGAPQEARVSVDGRLGTRLASTGNMRPPSISMGTRVSNKPVRSRLQLGAIPICCREIMKHPVTCVRRDDTVQDAARLMRDRDLGFVPVCDETGKVVGVLTDRDVATRVCAAGEPACETPVEAAMTRNVIACAPTDRLSRAIALMRQHRVTRVLVTDALGAPAGVISLSDVAQYERPWKIGRTLQTVAERKYAPERP